MKSNNVCDEAELKQLAARLRGRVIEMSHAAKAAHLASALSCCDIVAAAYGHALRIDPARPLDPGRDRFILSKGHAATALYATLAYRGFFDRRSSILTTTDGGKLAEHPSRQCVPGVEAATGSLGHGLPLAVGMALAARIKGILRRFCVLLSDGECEEGSVWEAAMFAPAQRLDNLA